jgi:hypothetical protein
VKLLLATLLVILFSTEAKAHDEPCFLELFAVPSGATIRVSFSWRADDYEEAIEDEGYVAEVTEGGSGQKLSVWRQPWATHYMSPFRATGSYVRIDGYKHPDSTTHSEGGEIEGCTITATINSLPPWLKETAQGAVPIMTFGTAGLGVVAIVYPPARLAAVGTAFMTAGVAWLAADPIECDSAVIARPIDYFVEPPFQDGDDAVTLLSNRIARNGTRTLGIARAAIKNANRAACPDFSDSERAALFTAAQNQGVRIGRHIARFKNQLVNLSAMLEQAGVVIDANEFVGTDYNFSDWHFNFTASVAGYSVNDLGLDGTLLTVLNEAELTDLKRVMMGVALIDFHACIDGSGPCQLYPAIWPTEGVATMAPFLDRLSSSLIGKETGL